MLFRLEIQYTYFSIPSKYPPYGIGLLGKFYFQKPRMVVEAQHAAEIVC